MCPINASLEVFGDRWSLLIIRDVMLRGFRTFKELLSSGEGIATNILAERLQRLEGAGILSASRDRDDGRKVVYRLTEKGIDLAPVLLELMLWSARHEETAITPAALRKAKAHREEWLAEVRKNWEAGASS